MKKKILYSVLLGSLLVACTMKNEPSETLPQRIQAYQVGDNAFEDYYQQYLNGLPEFLFQDECYGIRSNLLEMILEDEELDFESILQVLQGNNAFNYLWVCLMYSAIQASDIPINPEDTYHPYDETLVDSLLNNMIDSVYVTQNYRLSVFENDSIGEYEKFILSTAYATKNYIYTWFNDRTVVVKDLSNNYIVTHAPHSQNIPNFWETPLDVVEIYVDDIYDYREEDLGLLLWNLLISPTSEGDVFLFPSDADRQNYFAYLEHTCTLFYVTSEECTIQKDEAVDALLDEIASIVVVSLMGGVETVGAAAAGCSVYFLVKYTAIKIEYDDCLASAED